MKKESRCEKNEGKCISANEKCATKIIAKTCENSGLVCCKKTARRTQNDIIKKNKSSNNLGKNNLKNKTKKTKNNNPRTQNNKNSKRINKKNKKSNKRRRKMKRTKTKKRKLNIKQNNKENRKLKRKKSLGKKKSRQDLEEKKSK